MPRFLNTKGRRTLACGLCDRCHRKFPLDDLRRDGNAPGLMVCAADYDLIDPYKLGPAARDDVTLRFVRPDVSLTPNVLLDDHGQPVLDDNGDLIYLDPITGATPPPVIPPVVPSDTGNSLDFSDPNNSGYLPLV